jgi:hypothetical protein
MLISNEEIAVLIRKKREYLRLYGDLPRPEVVSWNLMQLLQRRDASKQSYDKTDLKYITEQLSQQDLEYL